MLIDTAGRYLLQESQPEVDAAEWLAFLDLLKKHRGRRALNGVLVAIPADVLAEGDASVRAHGREIRKRLARALRAARAPAAGLPARHQGRPRQGLRAELRRPRHRRARAGLGRDLRPGRARRRRRRGARARRAGRSASRRGSARAWRPRRSCRPAPSIFRFPAQVASLEPPARPPGRDHLRREPLRGERLAARLLPDLGHPGRHADRPAGRRARLVVRPAGRAGARRVPRSQPRSFFLKRLLTDVVFGEAGLGTLDPKAEARRTWIWRGAAVGAAAVLVLGALALTVSYLSNRGAVAAQASEFDRLRSYLAPVAARQAPLEPLDLDLALDAATEVQNARAPAARQLRPRRRPLRRAAGRGGAGHRLRPHAAQPSSSRAWSRCSRRRCGGRSATPSSSSARSRPTG